TPVREDDGEWLRLEVVTRGRRIWLRAWKAVVGRAMLYLLDSNDPANFPADRGITSELYGGGPQLRLTQESAPGMGGWQLLRRLGLGPEVCHLNEGHAAFAVLERARDFMESTAQPFDVAFAVTRAGNVFTTHTPVAAGFDRFPPDLVARALDGYARKGLGISIERLLGFGRERPEDASEPFNMALLAMRGSTAVNGVSRLHGDVSREIFQPLFPRWPRHEVPIGYVTNGVHVPTWDSAEADDLWTRACGKRRWVDGQGTPLADGLRSVGDAELWALRNANRAALVTDVRERFSRQRAAAGAPAAETEAAAPGFRPPGPPPPLPPPLAHLHHPHPPLSHPPHPGAPRSQGPRAVAPDPGRPAPARRPRQGAPRRHGRTAHGEAVDRVHAPARCRALGRVPGRLRHAARRAARAGRRRVD